MIARVFLLAYDRKTTFIFSMSSPSSVAIIVTTDKFHFSNCWSWRHYGSLTLFKMFRCYEVLKTVRINRTHVLPESLINFPANKYRKSWKKEATNPVYRQIKNCRKRYVHEWAHMVDIQGRRKKENKYLGHKMRRHRWRKLCPRLVDPEIMYQWFHFLW